MSPAPAGGVGTYPTLGDAVTGALDALLAATKAALADVDDAGLVMVVPGYYYPQLAQDQVTVEYATSDVAEGPATSTQRTHHDLQLAITFDVERVTDDESVTVSRALSLLAAVESYTRSTAPTLDGAVLWCRVTDSRLATSTDDTTAGEGRVTEIAATFSCRVVVRN